MKNVKGKEGGRSGALSRLSICENGSASAKSIREGAGEDAVVLDGGRARSEVHFMPVRKNPFPALKQIVLIDDRTFIRDCVSRCLEASYDEVALSSFSTIEDYLKADIDFNQVAFIMFSIHQRRPSSPDVQKSLTQLKSVCGAVPIIILSDVESVDYIREALEQGARGFISTSATLDVVVEATRVVWAGGTFVPASSLFMGWTGAAGSHASPLSARFTQRQLDVLQLMRQGMANKSIAHELTMSQSTVKVHVSNIMQKLKATNRTQAVFLSREFFEADVKD